MGLPTVCVLMSTYNGEKYIEEQIKSILGQKDVQVQLLLRDDGSSDGTLDICRDFAAAYGNVKFFRGKNLGVGKSFLSLLYNAPEAEYYAFADQDDVWLEDKLSRAVSMISRAERAEGAAQRFSGKLILSKDLAELPEGTGAVYPVLYASDQTLVDSRLEYIGDRRIDVDGCDMYSCISSNVMYGCTMVMNSLLRDKVIAAGLNEAIIRRKNHDGWVLYHAFATGLVVFDEESRILYRQHESNVVGGFDIGKKATLKDRFSNMFSKKHKGVRTKIARKLLELYGDEMNEDMRNKLSLISKANNVFTMRKILRDKELRPAFEKNDMLLYIKALIRWI